MLFIGHRPCRKPALASGATRAVTALRRPSGARWRLSGGLSLTLVILTTLAADARAQGARPNFQAPFACGQKISMHSYAHAPALDIFRVPRSRTEGSPLVAAAAGVVNQSYNAPSGGGRIIQINHGGGWFTTYIHLRSQAVRTGARVQQGTLIGRVGHTGKTSNGVSHLHFEMAIDRNGDGRADWGVPNGERVPPVFNGVTYGQRKNQVSVITSANTCASPSPSQPNPSPAPAPAGASKYLVDTFADAVGFLSGSCGQDAPSSTRCRPQGILRAGTNYVFCKVRGARVGSASQYNHWWLLTDLDVVYSGGRGRAFVSAYYLSRWGNDVAKDNAGHTIPNC